MADVQAIFGTLLALGIAFPGMLTAWWLLFPHKVNNSKNRIKTTPWKTFFTGIGGVILVGIPIIVLLNIQVPFARFLGAGTLFSALVFTSIGAAGLAALMADRMKDRVSPTTAPIKIFLLSAVALELAAAFPFLGWFIIIPITIIMSLGSMLFAIFQRKPKSETTPTPPTTTEA